MPLFFIISGFFAKKYTGKIARIKKLFSQRLIPVFVFAGLFIPIWLVKYKYFNGDFHITQIVNQSLSYLKGSPQLNFITWFLICLFTAEVNAVLLGIISDSRKINLYSGIFLIILGYLIIEKRAAISTYTGLQLNYWYIDESLIVLGFYLVGNWLFPVLMEIKEKKKWLIFTIVPVLLIVLTLTTTLGWNRSIVIMAISQHGEFLPFVIESLFGTILIICIGMIIPPNRITRFIGSNTLVLLGLNGLFFHFINSIVAKWTYVGDSFLITINCLVVSFLSILICVPIVFFLNTYFPFFFSKTDMLQKNNRNLKIWFNDNSQIRDR